MGLFKELSKKQLIILLISIVVFVGIVVFGLVRKQIRNQIPIINYKVYNEKNGWSNWSKDGKMAGDKIHNVQKMDFKLSKEFENTLCYTIYNDEYPNGELFNYNEKKKFKSINGISFSLNSEMTKKYNLCFRTYNKKDKWLDWACNDSISGNREEDITAIEIKIIRKNMLKSLELDDYGLAPDSQKNFGGE